VFGLGKTLERFGVERRYLANEIVGRREAEM